MDRGNESFSLRVQIEVVYAYRFLVLQSTCMMINLVYEHKHSPTTVTATVTATITATITTTLRESHHVAELKDLCSARLHRRRQRRQRHAHRG